MKNKKSSVLIGISVFILGILLGVIYSIFYPIKSSEKISPNILFLTQPVNMLSGKVEKISGNVATISIVSSPTTYQVLITDQTKIIKPQAYVNSPAQSGKLSIDDIKIGQYITVNSSVDLRTLSGNRIEATVITLPGVFNTLSGRITDINTGFLTLTTFAPPTSSEILIRMNPFPPAGKKFMVKLTGATEILQYPSSAPNLVTNLQPPTAPKKLSLADLKPDMPVTIYTDKDISNSQNLTALRIEPMMAPPASPSTGP